MDVGWLPVAWFGLGAGVVGCGVLAGRSRRAYRAGIATVSLLWLVAGAGANAWFLARGEDFSGFADLAPTAFVRDTWESLVVPHHTIFISLLIAFEAATGVLVLVPGRVRQAVLALLVAFNLALLSFGWGYLLWSIPMVVGLEGLRRAGGHERRTGPDAAASRTEVPAGR